MAKQATVRKRPAARKTVIAAKRVSPLDHVIRYGRFGADADGGPGVSFSLRHPASIVTVIARKGKVTALSAAMKKLYGFDVPAPGESAGDRGVGVHWCGPEQWYVVRSDSSDGVLYDELSERFDGLASISDQSHGRLIISIKGPRARDVLAKGTPVDFHPRAFGPGDCAVTQMAHVGVHIAQTGEDVFELSLFRGFAESFWDWLTEMALEYGYEVR